MKKLMIATTAVLVVAMLLLAGCGKGGELTTADLQKLLANDYEVEYIFAMAGLSIDGKSPAKDGDTLYFPVQSDKYKSTADVKKLLEATYTPEVVKRLLATTDSDGAQLYRDVEGVLHRSASPVIFGGTVTLNAKAAKLGTPEKNADGKNSVSFTVPEIAEEQEVGRVTMTAVQGKGGWRLADTYLSYGDGQDNEPPAADRPTTIDTANAFIAALVAQDVEQARYLSVPDPNSTMLGYGPNDYMYDYVTGCGVTSGEVVSTVSEDEMGAQYVVNLTVSDSNGSFKNGSNRYVMTISYNEAITDEGSISPVYVSGLWLQSDLPYEQLPYDQQTNRAINQVRRLVNLHGTVQFAAPSELNNDLLTEYLLYELVTAQPDKTEIGYTLDEVKSMATKLLGDQSFTPADRFLNAETETYILWGRGLNVGNNSLRQIEEGNGLVKLELLCYSEPLQLKPTSRIVYTVKNNWNGTYELVSAVLVQE